MSKVKLHKAIYQGQLSIESSSTCSFLEPKAMCAASRIAHYAHVWSSHGAHLRWTRNCPPWQISSLTASNAEPSRALLYSAHVPPQAQQNQQLQTRWLLSRSIFPRPSTAAMAHSTCPMSPAKGSRLLRRSSSPSSTLFAASFASQAPKATP